MTTVNDPLSWTLVITTPTSITAECHTLLCERLACTAATVGGKLAERRGKRVAEKPKTNLIELARSRTHQSVGEGQAVCRC